MTCEEVKFFLYQAEYITKTDIVSWEEVLKIVNDQEIISKTVTSEKSSNVFNAIDIDLEELSGNDLDEISNSNTLEAINAMLEIVNKNHVTM